MRYQKITDIVINNVLGFIRPFASKRLSLGIEKLLKPCCKITVVDSDATCSGEKLDVVLTLSETVNFLGLGQFTFFSTTGEVIGTGSFVNGNTISFESSAPNNATYTVSGTLFLPTNQSEDQGVYVNIPEFTLVFPSCS